MKSCYTGIIVKTLFVLCLKLGSIGCTAASFAIGTDVLTTEKRPSLDEVEIFLHSIGYSLQDTCKGLALHFPDELHSRSLEDEEDIEDTDQFFYINGIMAFTCVIVAALAAGLTMGLVSQELLDLKIKEMAGNVDEKKQARSVIPLIKDHHRLLVTLLLINAMANEALPLFLDKLVPAYVAVILSVTLVLFFGEIIPSAVFSGPKKLAISSKLAPVVQFLLWILCPLAWPIAKVLDKVLHEEEEGGSMQKYDRAELSALVRLEYEDRMAAKAKEKRRRANAGLDSSVKSNDQGNSGSVRFVKHIDTVNMVEGALEMQTRTAADIMVSLKDVFSISKDTILNKENILKIYRSGHSRVPVYEPSSKSHILGIFRTRQIMVLNETEKREVSTLPLTQPHFVEPQMNVLTLLNLLQEGSTANKGGHLAIVCLDPSIAESYLRRGEFVPDSAGVIGILTLEDCLEALIQEEIYDEYDIAEKRAMSRAAWAAKKWVKFVKQKKESRQFNASTAVADGEKVEDELSLLLP